MSLKDVFADLAEGMALGFAEEVVDQLKAESAMRPVNPQARSIGRQLADGMLELARQPDIALQSSEVRHVQGELLAPIRPAHEQELIEQQHAVWNMRQPPTPELLRALEDFQERCERDDQLE